MSLSKELKQRLRKIKKVKWEVKPEILLCPNVPKPLHGVAPRVVLGKKWWDVTRKEAYKSTAYHCKACGVSKHSARYHQWLEGHELYDVNYKKGLMRYVETVPLCHYCHNYIHDGRLQALLSKNQISQRYYAAILQHGDRVLGDSGIQKMTHYQREEALKVEVAFGNVAQWHSWRLVLFGKKYKPKYKTLIAWKKAYK